MTNDLGFSRLKQFRLGQFDLLYTILLQQTEASLMQIFYQITTYTHYIRAALRYSSTLSNPIEYRLNF